MWLWSVSWSTNCPVFFSFFLVDQKKIVQSQGIFGQSLGIFGRPNFFLVYQKFFWSTKNSQRLTKNSLRLGQDRIIGRPHGRDSIVRSISNFFSRPNFFWSTNKFFFGISTFFWYTSVLITSVTIIIIEYFFLGKDASAR